jgi:hypothetical protein
LPECPEGCVNAVCSAPGVCTCNEGYFKVEETGGCVPMCNVTCDCDEGWGDVNCSARDLNSALRR